jgi:diamine N-acetyltransferase
MEIITREATAEDAALIANMSRQTFYDSFAADNTAADMDKFLEEQFTLEALMAEVTGGKDIFFLAYQDSLPLGYAKLREKPLAGHETAPAIEIARIYVVKDKIGAGVGKVLMEACIDKAKKMAKAIIWLGVWEKNQRAIDFYKKWGFEKTGEQDFLLGNDLQRDWTMKKSLLA